MKKTFVFALGGMALVAIVYALAMAYEAKLANSAQLPLSTCSRVATSTSRNVGPNGAQNDSAAAASGNGDISPLVAATTTDRSFLRVSNVGQIPVWLNLGYATVTPGSGMWLAASSTVTFEDGTLF